MRDRQLFNQIASRPDGDSSEDGDHLRFLADFALHMRDGNPRVALQAASEACHAAPHLSGPHYAYGEAWLALNAPARAEQAFATAIQIAPEWADAWINYGLARYRLGSIEDAKTAMCQALRQAPDHPAALANLGTFLRVSGEHEASETLLRRALAKTPGNEALRLRLAADLLQEERAAEALALLDETSAPPIEPRALRDWHLQRSLALLRLARPAEARSVLDALGSMGPIPAEFAPFWHWRHVLLALADGRLAVAGQAAGRMEAALGAMGSDTMLEDSILARFNLAQFWLSQNEHKAAFAQWRAGHALLRTIQPFSRDEHLAFIEANIAAFPAARFTDGARAGNNDPAPVFIVGMPRSGTTLCEQIIAAHAQCHGAGERGALGATVRRLGEGGENASMIRRIAALGDTALDAAAARYLADLHSLAPDASRIVDKLPGNYRYLGLVGLMLPGAKIIHCVRDPRDIGLSIFTFRFHGQHGYAHDLADLGWAIAQQERLMAHWRAVLPNAVLTVRLSDWVTHFDATLARVLAHVDLPHDPGCVRFHEMDSRVRTVSRKQVRQPVNASGLGRWRHYEDELTPLIDELERAGALNAWRGMAAEFRPRVSRIPD